MRVLFDLLYIQRSSVTGVSIYAERLIRGFLSCNNGVSIVVLVLPDYATDFKIRFPSIPYVIINRKVKNQYLNCLIDNLGIDLFFSPYLYIWSIAGLKIPQIAVIHDIQSLFLQKNIVYRTLYKALLYNKLKIVDRIITISEYSKNSIVEKFPSFGSKIDVVYNSIDFVSKVNMAKYEEFKPYILDVNSLVPYKNIETLINAFALIKNQIPHNLVIKGSPNKYWEKSVKPLILSKQLETRVYLVDTKFTDEEMACLYHNADLFVSPSKMEGFGFTPIEAAIYEVPVITSKESALQETTLGLLNYYDNVLDPKSLANKIIEVLSQPKDVLKNISSRFKFVYSLDLQVNRIYNIFKKEYDESRN
jgi:glycosyltransferase involved in cell wall biosynthesis